MKQFKKIYIEITNRCNKNCSFCSPVNRPKKEMSIQEFEHVLKEIEPYTDYVYLHVKGEPLLHAEFKEILTLCKKYNILINLTSNGTLLKKQLPILCEVKGVRQLNLSLHSLEDESLLTEILTCSDVLLAETSTMIQYRFWALQEGIFSDLQKKMLHKIQTHFQVSTDLQALLENQDNVTVIPRVYLSKEGLWEWPTMESDFYSIEGSCYGGRSHIAILSDGTVVPCCLDSDAKIPLGNIFDTPLSTIVKQERYLALVQGFQNHKRSEELCKRCRYLNTLKMNQQKN